MPAEGYRIPVNDGLNGNFLKDVIDGMYDWVRVIDRDDNVIYLNRAMREGLRCNPVGEKCYRAVGRETPCDNCTSRRAAFEGIPFYKEETIGGRIFSVASSPVRNSGGEIIAVVEVLRDITKIKKLQDRVVEQNRRMQGDLEMAKKLQLSLLPQKALEGDIDFAYVYRPCEALGGDFLGFSAIDESHAALYIADVSGHGVSAAMLTVFLHSMLGKKTLSPAQALTGLYREFNGAGFDKDMYITVFYAIIDLDSGCMVFSNAGHGVRPIVFGKNRFEFLHLPGIPISDWLKEPGYRDAKIPLSNGDRVFMCTDGVIELRNPEGEQFGEERIIEILTDEKSGNEDKLRRITARALEFAGLDDFSAIPDDITMALFEIRRK